MKQNKNRYQNFF